MYFNGEGVPQNYATATQWFEKAAAEGNVNSQNQLSDIYELGLGCGKNFTKAVE